jgi:ABC-type uncharacterized transport system ATPase subunit
MWRTTALTRAGLLDCATNHYLKKPALADGWPCRGGKLIASGTVASVRSLVSRKEIGCETSLAVEEVKAWPDVVSAAHDGRRLHITAVDAEDVVRRLLAADAGVRDLEVRQAGLAAAFSQLTKEVA